jgi:hypothetical protein
MLTDIFACPAISKPGIQRQVEHMTVAVPTKRKSPDLVVVAVIPLPYMRKKMKTYDIDYGLTIKRVYLEGMDRHIPVEIPTKLNVLKE